MTFVLYDVETTGLSKRFDQIVQFAAVRADADLGIIDRLELRCRLMPHIIPSPEALHATGLRIGQLVDPGLDSHFEMVRAARRTLQSWCPTLFLGFNSLSFDEEFLRHAFYQCLYNAYLTNTQQSARADLLNLCRVTAALRPDVLKPAVDEAGRPVFRLKPLAEANGVAAPMAHDAMADVMTMHALAVHIRTRAPEIWSQFLRFSQKASVEAFIAEEDAFLLSEVVGNRHRARLVTHIGRHSEQANRHYCLDLSADLDVLRRSSDDELAAICASIDRPVATVRTNAAPTLWALYDATPGHLAPFDEAEVLGRVKELRREAAFVERLRAAVQAAERIYPPSPHVEDQLYERGFPPPEDEALMVRFHDATWEERAVLASRFADERYRRLALRLVYFERPDLLASKQRAMFEQQLRDRVLSPTGTDTPWRSLAAARREAEALIAGGLDGEDLMRQRELMAYLDKRADALAPLAV